MSEGEGGESKGFFARIFNRTLYRQGKGADLTQVPVSKLQEAAERGVRIDLTSSKPGEVKARVNKIVVKGDDEP
jgi:hypothetical protein